MKPKVDTKKDIESQVIRTLQYYSHFSYAPDFNQIYAALPEPIKRYKLENTLARMYKNGKVEMRKATNEISSREVTLYTMGGEGIFIPETLKKHTITLVKLKQVERFMKLCQWVPGVNLIGLSGSCTMGNASQHDDVDVFIITGKKRMWTVRFLTIVCAYVCGVKRKRNVRRAPNKVCLNMYLDMSDLVMPVTKRNRYIAHEIIQMKPLSAWFQGVNKRYLLREKQTYMHFLKLNDWLYEYVPNFTYTGMGISKKTKRKGQRLTLLGNIIEFILKQIQLTFIRRHKQRSEIIGDTQLWFFPHDYQKNVKSFLE